MLTDDRIRAQLPHALGKLDLPALGELYRGKVRDNCSRS
jgi:phosphoribosylaminoimidazole-succinocarboxamide synthase